MPSLGEKVQVGSPRAQLSDLVEVCWLVSKIEIINGNETSPGASGFSSPSTLMSQR